MAAPSPPAGWRSGMDLPGSVAPFILRGVSLLGIDSVMAPKALQAGGLAATGGELDHGKLAALSTTIGFDDIIDAASAIVEGPDPRPRRRRDLRRRKIDRPLKFDRSAEIFPNRSVSMP